MTPADKAYIAGVVDSEGSIGLYRSNTKYWLPRFSVGSTYKPLLVWLQEQLGGPAVYIKRDRRNKKWARKTFYGWSLYKREDLVRVLTMLAPYMREKRRKAHTLLRYLEGQLTASAARQVLRRRRRPRNG